MSANQIETPARTRIRSRVVLFLLIGWIFCLGNPEQQAAVGTEPPEPRNLWLLARRQPDPAPALRKPWVLREREIMLDVPLLQILKDPAARPHPRVTVELFEGNRHELDITSTVSRINDTAVIRGTFKPPSQGEFTLVASGSLLIGSFQMGSRLYKTEHVVNGRLKLLEVDPRKAPPE